MVYKWPFIQYEKRNNTFYYLLWNNFLTLNIKQNDFIVKRNNSIIYLSSNEISGIPNKIEIKKISIRKEYHYINFVILEYNKFYLFTSDGEIHFYKFKKDGKFFLKEKINNDLLNNVSLVKICYYKKSNFLMISNKGLLYNFDLNKNLISEINNRLGEKERNVSVKYKMKIFKFIEDLNCFVYENQNNEIVLFSLCDFVVLQKIVTNEKIYNVIFISDFPLIY